MLQPVTINRAMTAREWALLFVLSVLWGGTFFFIAVAVKELPPLTLAALRVTIAMLALLATLLVLGQRLPMRREAWIAFAGMGLLNNAGPFALLNWGQSLIPSSVASILLGTTPFFTAILAHVWTHDEKLTSGRAFGVLFGIAGIVTMVGSSAMHAFTADVAGQLAIVGAAIGYAISSIWGRRLGRLGISPLVSAAGMLVVSTAVMVPVALLFDHPWTLPWPSHGAIAAVLGVAIPSTAIAYVLYFHLLRTAGAFNLMLVSFLIPMTAILLGVLILHEHLAPRHWGGMALIALGLVAIDGRAWRNFRRK